MPTLAFTGTRRFTNSDLLTFIASETLSDGDARGLGHWDWFADFNEFVTGACVGFDAIIGEALARWPRTAEAKHTVVVPSDHSQIHEWWRQVDLVDRVNVYRMPLGTTYRDRNTELVRRGDALFYAADWPEHHGSSRRSGTWQTIRLAYKLGLPVKGFVLNEEKNDHARS